LVFLIPNYCKNVLCPSSSKCGQYRKWLFIIKYQHYWINQTHKDTSFDIVEKNPPFWVVIKQI
jgi:hypothetical protein